MAEKSEDKCEIKWSKGKQMFALVIDDQFLVQEWKSGVDEGRRHWHLKNLSAKVDYSRGRERRCSSLWAATVIFLGVAIVLYFSSLNRHVPLLAPLMVFIGFILMYKAIRLSKVETWTIIQKDNGEYAAYITHRGCSEEEIKKFTECFVYAVKKAKKESIQNESKKSEV